jgi:uncharacterized membrane protein
MYIGENFDFNLRGRNLLFASYLVIATLFVLAVATFFLIFDKEPAFIVFGADVVLAAVLLPLSYYDIRKLEKAKADESKKQGRG